MKNSRAGIFALAAALLAAGSVHAQESRWRPFASITPVYQGKGDLDQGGDYSVWRAAARAGVTGQLSPGVGGGVTLRYEYANYSFSSPAAFGGVAPWSIVQEYGVAIPLSFGLTDGWSIGVVPSVDWFRENGADTGDSLVWGGIVSAVRRFDNGSRLGLGVGAFDQIEKNEVFVFPIVDWRLAERWRVINPLAAGPTGPAGLELDYLVDEDWTIGVGAARRRDRFRLSETGPVPNGVGEERGVPVFLRATRRLGKEMSLHLYAGVIADGRLRVEDRSGNLVREDDFDPAPFVGATLLGRF